jgi:hypothetical protein
VEVHQAAPNFMMTSLYAYGPEETFVYPPKPANPKAIWNIAWQARIRHRSSTSLILGMPGMDSASDASDDKKTECQPRKKRGLGGLGGFIGGAIGAATGGGGDGC